MNWKDFWQEYPSRDSDLDLYQQVGKTKHGKAINPEQLESIVKTIKSKLDLQPEDVLLDLCCGNGLITQELSASVSKIVAVDFSRPLIETAKVKAAKHNIEYSEFDVKLIAQFDGLKSMGVTKVMCYEALSFFEHDDLNQILKAIADNTKADKVFFGSVLDFDKRFNFYNTFRRKLLYYKVKYTGKDFGLGHWWKMKDISSISDGLGFELEVSEQDGLLHTSHFRNDLMLTRTFKR